MLFFQGFNAPPVVRWVPKKLGFRPIVTMARWADRGKLGDKQKAVRPILANVRASNPGILGQSLLNQNEVHGHLLETLTRFKARFGAQAPDLYLVVADLRNCYDRIPHEPLLEKIQQLPLKKEYHIFPISMQRGAGRYQSMDLALEDTVKLHDLVTSARCPPSLKREPLVIMPKNSQMQVTCEHGEISGQFGRVFVGLFLVTTITITYYAVIALDAPIFCRSVLDLRSHDFFPS